MKRKIIYFAIFLLFVQSVATAQKFEKGTNVINAGIGFGGQYGSYTTSSQSPVYSINYERGVWDVPGPGVVSLGAYLGHKTYKYTNDNKWSYTIVGIRGAYHYNGLDVKNLDVYAGVMAAYNILSYSGTGSYGNEFGFTGFLGGRWFFTDNIAVFVEAGYGVSNLSAGVSFKF